MNTGDQNETSSEPLTYISVGTWFLLKKVRKEFASWLGKRSFEIREDDPDQLQSLFKAVNELKNKSLTQWQKIYSDREFTGKLPTDATMSADAPIINNFNSLLKYLEESVGDFSTSYEDKVVPLGRWVQWIEKLLIPYLGSLDHHEDKIGVWFPPERFLKKKYSENPTEDMPYPFLKPLAFNLMTTTEEKDRSGARQEFSKGVDIKERLPKGMAGLMSKIIGKYSLLDVPSRDIDKVVGNASALLLRLEDEGDLLGMLLITSPIFGLFHELLTLPTRRPKELKANFYDSVYVCEKELGSDNDLFDDVENINGLSIIKCKCDEQPGVAKKCFFRDLMPELDYLVLDYLRGFRRFRMQEKIENEANISHHFIGGIKPLDYLINLAKKQIEKKPSFENDEVYKTIINAQLRSNELKAKISHSRFDALNFYGKPNTTGEIEAVIEHFEQWNKLLYIRAENVEFKRETIGDPREIPGTNEEWDFILSYVLSNAFAAANPYGGCPEGYKPMVGVKLNFQDKDIFSLEVSNTVPLPISDELVGMMQELIDGSKEQMPRKLSKGTGKGIYYAGKYIARNRMKANYFTMDNGYKVRLKIYFS